MRLTLLFISIFSLVSLSGCSDDNAATSSESHILDSQMKAMDKARQVEGDINDAMQRRDKEINR